MKRKVFKIISILFYVGIMVALLMPTVVNAFWYGNEITDDISPATADALHDHLVVNVLPELSPMPPGFFYSHNSNPDGITGVRINNPEKTSKGYTLLSAMGGHVPSPPFPYYNGILIDAEGNIVNEWTMAIFGVPAKMLPGGYLLGGGPPGVFGPEAGHLVQYDWCGNIYKEWSGIGEYPAWDGRFHHDFQREGNPVGYYAPGLRPNTKSGKTLILSNFWPSDQVPPIDTSHISNFPLFDDVFYEVDWDENVSWEWHAYEHFDDNDCLNEDGTRRPGCLTMGFDAKAKDAIMNILVPDQFGATGTDWQHINSMSYIGPNKWYDDGDLRFHPDNIIWDSRTNNIMAIVARNDHPDGDWVSGDIIWRVGPHYSASYKEHKLSQIIGMHNAHMIPKDLPGAGNILVFDNGGTAGYGSLLPGLPGTYPSTYRNYSRVIEFDPITLDIVWEYSDPVQEGDINLDGEVKGAERKFYSALISNSQRLQNGNTLITEGSWGRVFEVTTAGEIVWEYVSPFSDVPLPAPPFLIGANSTFRAYRVPFSWVPKNPKCGE